MKAIYTATAPALEADPDQRPHLFVSVDDSHYLEIETPCDVTPDRYSEIAAAFEVKESTDADGFQHFQGNVTIAKRWLKYGTQLTVTFHDPISVPDAEVPA